MKSSSGKRERSGSESELVFLPLWDPRDLMYSEKRLAEPQAQPVW